MRQLVLMMAMMLALSGCHLPSLIQSIPQAASAPAAGAINTAMTLHGRVELAAFSLKPSSYKTTTYKAQATVGEIATGATVSLINVTTNQTVGTSLTDANGNFQLTFGSQFRAQVGGIYYLEAIKGLGQNRAGVSVARLRTLISWSANNAWVSISSANPGDPITISRSTTALAAITSLRQVAGNPVNTGALIGSVQVGVPDSQGYDTFAPGASGIAGSDYDTVMGLVTDAIARDQDPLGVIIYDTVNYTFIRVTAGFTVSGLNPANGPINQPVIISGTNFDPVPANDIVRFNGVQATVTSASSTALKVAVPAGATSGLVSVQIGGLVLAGVTYTVTSSDGHNIFDPQGKLYAVSGLSNNVYSVSPNGVLTRTASNSLLNNPYGLTYASGSLYVACYSNSTIAKVDSSGNVTPFSTAIGNPRSIIVDPSGNLYAANYQTIYKLSATGTATQFAAGFSSIQGMAFNNGILYVVDSGTNRISQVASNGTVTTFVSGLSNPTGLAFDTASNLYVANQNDNTILKFDPNGLQSLFASVTSPLGLAFNANGTFYTTTQNTNTVYQITLTGAVRPYLSGINDPVGLNIDSTGAISFLNRGSSNMVKAPAGGYINSFASGFSRPYDAVQAPSGAIYTANYNSSSISRVDPNGSINIIANIAYPTAVAYYAPTNTLGVYNGSAYTINLNTNAVTTYANPLNGTNKLLTLPNGDILASTNTGVAKIATGSVATITAKFNTSLGWCWGMFLESSGSVLVACPGSGKIVRMNPSTGLTTDVVTGLYYPYGIAEDASNNLYYASFYGSYINKVLPNGTVTRLWSYLSSGSPYYPTDLAILNNKLYIFNLYQYNILQYDFSTATGSVAIAQGAAPLNMTALSQANFTTDGTSLYWPYYSSTYGYEVASMSATTATNLSAGYAYCWSPLTYGSNQLFSANGSAIIQQSLYGSNARAYATGYSNNCLAFDANGNLLVGGYGGQVAKTDVTTGLTSTFAALPGLNNTLYHIAINPSDGNLYATDYYYVYKAPVTGGTFTQVSNYNYGMSSFAFTPTGTLIALNTPYNYLNQFNASNNLWTTLDISCNQPRF